MVTDDARRARQRRLRTGAYGHNPERAKTARQRQRRHERIAEKRALLDGRAPAESEFGMAKKTELVPAAARDVPHQEILDVPAAVPVSDRLRAEVAAFDRELEELGRRHGEAEYLIRRTVLSARRGDAGAMEEVAACERENRRIADEMRHVRAARDACLAELQAALDAEAAVARAAHAAEAEAFATALETRGVEGDKLLLDFRAWYLSVKADLVAAGGAGFGPAIAPLEVMMREIFRSALWGIHELQLPAPSVRGRTYTDLMKGYANAARGAVPRIVAPPVPRPALPAPASAPSPASGETRKLPLHTDIGERLPGDPPEFKIKNVGRSA